MKPSSASAAVQQRAPSTNGGEAFASRASAVLASPLAVMIIVPSLVAVVGAVLMLFGDVALRGSNLDVARARLANQAEVVRRTMRLALSQADPMLDRLGGMVEQHDTAGPFEGFAHALADLIQARAGITYVSASFPDGTFQGVYLAQGKLAFQDSRLTPLGTRVRRYHFSARAELELFQEEITAYDPRQRGFYRLATQRGRSVWTDPYPFFKSHITGITRARPLYRQTSGQRELLAVLTVDYDVQALSRLLQDRTLEGVRAVLYARDGSVLALEQANGTAPAIPQEDRALRFSDLTDPVLRALYERVKDQPQAAFAMKRLVVGKEPFLAVVTRASADPELDWWAAYLAPERAYLGELHRYQIRSLWTSAAVLLLSCFVASAFARHVTRTRREIAAARADAARARENARELGSYRLVSCLGRGGMGEVWRAQHRLLAREAAIKLIKRAEDGEDNEELQLRFRREAEALSALRSRHTIELFDYGVADDGTFFFVMELLDGMDLETLVLRHGPQPVARVVPILIQVCASLCEAHEAGLVHRDIKPANIFICRAADELDVVKVLDFGLVRAVRRGGDLGVAADLTQAGVTTNLTASGGALGTPGYMAPEQALGQEIDGRADLYALGCVAVWLLRGRELFDQQTPQQRLVASITETPNLVACLPAAVPDELRSLIGACLAKAPEQRPASARALGKALRALVLPSSPAWSAEKADAFWSEQARLSVASAAAGEQVELVRAGFAKGRAGR